MSDEIRRVCSTGSFWMWELDRTFGVIAEAGFDAVELMVTRDPRTQNPEHPARLAKSNGLEIVAVHAPMLMLTRRIWGPNFMNIVDRSTDLAASLGADVVVVHPPYLWELKYQAWLLRGLDKYSADKGLAIAVENMFRLWVRGRPVRGHRWVSPSDLEGFTQLTLDTSHCGVDGYDILEALDRVGPQMAHIHLSDSRMDGRDNHLLPGEGKLPLKEFLSRLGGVGFRAGLSLELDMRPYAADDHRAVEGLTRARDFVEENLQ